MPLHRNHCLKTLPVAALGLALLALSPGCRILPGGAPRATPFEESLMVEIAPPTLSDETLATIDGICRRLVDERMTPGVVVLIGRGEHVLLRKAWGYRMREPHEEPMTVDTVFDLASLTKPICTASAIMLLVQDGEISLDDSIVDHVPEFRGRGKHTITLRRLLTHTSGLPPYTNAVRLEAEAGPPPRPDALIEKIASLPAEARPGERVIYSCLNYLTLARVVRNVTGLRQDVFLRERMWRPLGMKDTTWFPGPGLRPRVAPTARAGDVIRRGRVHDPLAAYSVSEFYAPGNAGCFSTADDLVRYCRLVLGGGELDGVRIFEPETMERITTDQTGDLAGGRTCGWGVSEMHAYHTPLNTTPETCCLIHTGYTGGLVWIDKLSRTYVIFMSNCVYPRDIGSHKSAVIAGRRDIVRAVIEGTDIYEDAQWPEESDQAGESGAAD